MSDKKIKELERKFLTNPEGYSLEFAVGMLRAGRSGYEVFKVLCDYNVLQEVSEYFNRHGYPSLIPRGETNYDIDFRFVMEEYLVPGFRDMEIPNQFEPHEDIEYIADNFYEYRIVEPISSIDEKIEFFKEYIRRHGDIDIEADPERLDVPLRYRNVCQIIDYWQDRLRRKAIRIAREKLDEDGNILKYVLSLLEAGLSGYQAFIMANSQGYLTEVLPYFEEHGYPSLIPEHITIPDPRFVTDGLQVRDQLYDRLISVPNASGYADFANKYAEIHGDFDMYRIPRDIEEPLKYTHFYDILNHWIQHG